MNMNLAVISDLHIGLAARGKDLCPEPPPNRRKDRKVYNEKVDYEYGKKFIEFLQREKVSAEYLILPGDMTNNADPEEVELASDFVLQAADALGVNHDAIVFAPGNHDVDWSVLRQKDKTGVRWLQRYETLGSSKFHFRRLIELGKGDVLAPPHFIAWTFDDLLVVSYNSASHDKPIIEVAAHHGLADPEHLTAIREHLDGIGDANGRLRLFLVHHHPLNYTQPIPKMPEFSTMTNAESLLELVHESRFDLLIHGHMHFPRFGALSTQTYPHLPILCSGSFSIEIDTRWAGTVDNQFHLVTVERGTTPGSRIKGKVTSWAYNYCRGWIPSEKSTSGIHHVIPFGNYVMPDELDARLQPYVELRFAERSHVLWRNVVEKFPDLEHLPIESAITAFDRLAAQFNCTRMYDTLNELILFQED